MTDRIAKFVAGLDGENSDNISCEQWRAGDYRY